VHGKPKQVEIAATPDVGYHNWAGDLTLVGYHNGARRPHTCGVPQWGWETSHL